MESKPLEQLTGGHLVAKSLVAEGVTHVFTLCGGHITPIYKACDDEKIKVIDVRHEQAATMAADGFARITRQPAVALVTAGPGVTNALTGIANAFRAQSPLITIGGRSPFASFEMGALQEMDHVEFVRPLTKWARPVLETRRIPDFVHMAFRHADSDVKGPVFLEIPMDILWGFAEVSQSSVRTRTKARPGGDPAYVETAARLLHEAERPVVIAGSAIWWDDAADDLIGLVERAIAPVFTNGMGRGSVPPDHRLFFQHARRSALSKADVIVVAGTPLDFRLSYGQAPAWSEQARVIQIDRLGAQIGHNRAADVGIVGDSRSVLREINECLADMGEHRARGAWIEALREEEKAKQAKQAVREKSDRTPVDGFRIAREVADAIDHDTIVIGDGGDFVAVASKVIPVHRPGHWMDPGPFGCLGVGVPYAIAAKAARPERRVLLLLGDGTFGFNGMEFDTAVRHKLPFVAVVGNDAGWGQIRAPQQQFYGEKCTVATDLASTRYDRVVEALGGHGEHVTKPEQIRPAIERAFASGKPALVNVEMDPKLGESGGYMRGM